jgi:cell division protein FtsI (penicillin-binding protein 3)
MKRLFQRSSAAGHVGNVRSLNYSTSPLLASRTPAWRSRFLVALVGAGFCVLVGRAAYVQVIGSDFFQRQGEIR